MQQLDRQWAYTLKRQPANGHPPAQTAQPALLSVSDGSSPKKHILQLHLMDFTATELVGAVVAKISSPPHQRVKEYDIVHYLKENGTEYQDHLPHFYAHYDYKFAQKTAEAHLHTWEKFTGYDMRHQQVIVQDLHYPITQIYVLKDMAAAYADINGGKFMSIRLVTLMVMYQQLLFGLNPREFITVM